MTVRLVGEIVFLEGSCAVEEAEALVSLLEAQPGRTIDMTGCTGLHASLLQVLLAFTPLLRGEPDDMFLRDWILPPLVARSRDIAVSQ